MLHLKRTEIKIEDCLLITTIIIELLKIEDCLFIANYNFKPIVLRFLVFSQSTISYHMSLLMTTIEKVKTVIDFNQSI